MDEYFNYFLDDEGFGPAVHSIPVAPEVFDRYREILPNRLLAYWQAYGFCGYADGLFWTVNPDDYAELLAGWLKKTPLAEQENHYVIARTAFGELYAWGDKSKNTSILEPHYNTILPADIPAEAVGDEQCERRIGLFFDSKSKDSVDFYDRDEKLLFARAMKKLGALEHDEMYTFVPALALGGAATIDNLKKARIYEQLALLIELDNPQVLQSVGQLF